MDSDPDPNQAPDFSICNHTQTPAQDNLQMISNPAIKAYYDRCLYQLTKSLLHQAQAEYARQYELDLDQAQPPGSPPLAPKASVPQAFTLGLLNNPSHAVLDLQPEQEVVASIAQAALDHFNALSDSSNEDLEWLYAPSNDDLLEVTVIVNDDIETASHGCKRACTADHTATSCWWFPWQVKVKQLDLFLWLLKVNDVDDVPSVKTIQSLNSALQKCCGIGTITYKGALGNHYHVNNLAHIISQEMSNPKVRPHLHFYPKDSGLWLSEARQGLCWLCEVPDEQLTPMARLNSHDYYIHEPAMLSNGHCWAMEPVDTDHQRSWKVIKSVVDSKTSSTSEWAFTDPNVGNRWRALSKRHKVLSFPIWMYCNNMSGLPCSEAQQEYNVHFLCTSNLAPPLEMLDGIVGQLKHVNFLLLYNTWTNSINFLETHKKVVFGHGTLKQMSQSFFYPSYLLCWETILCRDCVANFFVVHAGSKELMLLPTSSSQQASVSTKKAMEPKVMQTAKWPATTVQMKEHPIQPVKLKVGKPRNKQETITQLCAQFVQASQLDSKTKVNKMRTESGIKDTFQKYFIDKVVGSYQRLRGVASKQAALDESIASFPDTIISPVWRIKGLDPHQDTPVKILHIVLLGFVKYLWRDLVQLQLKGKPDKLNLLATRLSSLNVNGLGISPLAGKTLVQYSGSLTGQDFCAIVQVAPFVIYDLVSKECMDTWVALSKLIPLIYQPEIHDINAHLHNGHVVGLTSQNFTFLYT
ncbi:hypothetical protein SERLADRAFT_407303 [Serpula lacrymans var. lacrymans S7.9]|uniref:Uncharacterized protein n=1 Tax=Serpula lacrymans var. lacrymans (strain S7.9) TaxID=578457 RepID=F8NQA0_SERL9|nr:uncharacterized protein SERLADRAFT_407303 [Serpula lacrymans var. lacrymans S7.9]EGO26560.1 hypothetical protein SERLADRAFT_407303 [Serpula lacrymans var. lacrymans S7.9]